MDIAIVPFVAELHWKFLEAEAMNAADKWPHVWRREPGLKYRMADLVRRATMFGRAVVAVVPDDPSLFVGYLASPEPQVIAYAYVKYACRRMRVASRLAAACLINLGKPTALEIWTPAASRIAAAGTCRLYPAIPREQDRT